MRIIILSSNYPRKKTPNNGVFIHQQVKALTKLGVSCEVVMPYNWYPPMGLHTLHPYWVAGYNEHQTHIEGELDGVKITSLPVFVPMPSRLFPGRFYHRAAKKVAQYLNKIGFDKKKDWVLAYFLNDSGYIATKVKEQTGVNVAVMGRGDDIHAWPEQDATLIPDIQFVYHHANLLLANSKRLAKDAEKWMQPGNVRNLDVVYNGIDYKKFTPVIPEEKISLQKANGLQGNTKYIICVATRVATKGWLELLAAIKKMGDDFTGWRLITVAPPYHYKDGISIEDVAKELGIEEYIHHMGRLDHEVLAELMKACDAFILPSYNEGLANALLEAMATGLPCIATDVGGHAEVIENNKNGILIAPKSVGEIVGALKKIVADDEFRHRLGKEARSSMIAFGDYKKNAAQLFDMMKSYKSEL